jgi:hypothetical protein
MALTEILLGAIRGLQIIFSVFTLGLSAGAVSQLNKYNVGANAPNRFSVFASIWSLLSVIFLIFSQFLFVHQYSGYSTYINLAVVIEFLNWIFVFASFVSIAQYGASPNCDNRNLFYRPLSAPCRTDKALVGFGVLLWLTWSASLFIICKLKVRERREDQSSKELELRIRNAVERQADEAAVHASAPVAETEK